MSNNQIDKVLSHGVHSDITTSGLQKGDQVSIKENFCKLNSLPQTTEMGKKDGAKMNRQQQIAAEKAGAPISKSQPIFEQVFKLVKNSMVAMLQLLNEIKAELKNFNSFQKDDIKNEKKQWQKFFTEKADAYKVARSTLESLASKQQWIAVAGIMMSKKGESLPQDSKQTIRGCFPSNESISQYIPRTFEIANSVLQHTPETLSIFVNDYITNQPAKLGLTTTGSLLTQLSTSKNSEMQTADHTLQANQTMADGMKDAHRMTYDAAKEFDQQVSGAIEHLNQTIAELIRIEAKAYESRG